jgi:uncharacterized protein (TIGR02391 family)
MAKINGRGSQAVENFTNRTRPMPLTAPQLATFSPTQAQAAIQQLEARIGDLERLNLDAINAWRDPTVLALEHAIEATLARIFGPQSHEYRQLQIAAQLDARQTTTRHLPYLDEVREAVQQNSARALALLKQAVSLMKEQSGVGGRASADRAIRAYANLDLHPEIAQAASDLYRDGHYANSIEDAVKALNALVRLRSGVELDGTALMQKVLSPNAPVLRFNDLADQSDRDEQLGFMMMFAGAVAGLRNPRAHKLIKDDPERALEFIAFVSLLAKLLDGAKKTPKPATS